MRDVNKSQTKGAEMKTLTEQGYKLIDNSSNSANYAKVNSNGTVTVQTIHLYGKTVVKTFAKNEFSAWRKSIKRTESALTRLASLCGANESGLNVPESVWNIMKADFEVKESI